MKFQCHMNDLKAALAFSSRDEMRYILNGVKVESKPDKFPILVGCDGRCICAVQTVCCQIDAVPGEAILCHDTLKLIFRIFQQKGALEIETKPDEKTGKETVFVKQNKLTLEVREGCIEGDYPKWRMVIPRKNKARTPLSSVSLNPRFLGKLHEIAQLLGEKDSAARFWFIDETAVVIAQIPKLPNVWAGIMPARDPVSDEIWEPEWLDLPLIEEGKKPATSPTK